MTLGRVTSGPFPRRRRLSVLNVVVILCALLALAALALELGFDDPPLPVDILIGIQLGAVAIYGVSRVVALVTAPLLIAELRANAMDGALLLIAGLYLLFRFELSAQPVLKVSALCIGVIQILVLVRLGIEAIRLNLSLSQSALHPTRVITLTFCSLILVGTLALALPKSTQPNLRGRSEFSVPTHLLNCAFTATSATCVTGLAVYDTASDFTMFGQCVILALIQAGGLGIMIFASLFGMLAGRQLSLRHSLAMQDAISYRTLGQMRSMIIFVVLSTLIIEAIGAIILYPMWLGDISVGRRVFLSVFHAVSSFCNAGFSLQSDNLIPYRLSWQVYGCIMPLIILGGLGFPVLRDLAGACHAKTRDVLVRRLAEPFRGGSRPQIRITLHSKLVLLSSAMLIATSASLFVCIETQPQSAGPIAMDGTGHLGVEQEPISGRLLDALFLSVTSRTAGFNTVTMDVENMTPATHLVTMVLMFIGGSPASTAGGVKTVAFSVLLLAVWSTLRGRGRVEAFGRTIPESVVRRAAVVTMVMFSVVSLVTLVLCVAEPVSLRSAMFEAVSACGTVGLSTGLTPELTAAGRVAIMLAMFVGRLGPLTLLIALAGDLKPARYDYPMEHVGIG